MLIIQLKYANYLIGVITIFIITFSCTQQETTKINTQITATASTTKITLYKLSTHTIKVETVTTIRLTMDNYAVVVKLFSRYFLDNLFDGLQYV